MLCVALTGSIASGKSLTAGFFKACGAFVIDSDAVSRAVVVPGHEGLKRIVDYFGSEIICDNGTLDRARLGSIVFGDKTKRKLLNSILHKLILEGIKKDIDFISLTQPSAIVIVELPLLIECGLQNDFDRIIVVSVKQDLQTKRLLKRNNLTAEEAGQRIQAQIDSKVQEIYADYIIDNNGSVETLEKQVKYTYAMLERDAKVGAWQKKSNGNLTKYLTFLLNILKI